MTAGAMRLYDTQRSGNAWKVRLLAGFLGMPLERVTLSIDCGDLGTPGFGAVSPLRQVPVLELDDGRTVFESLAILSWLAEGTAWLPRDTYERTQVFSWMSFEQTQHMHPLAQLRLHLALHPGRPLPLERLYEWRAQGEAALAVLDRVLTEQGADGWFTTKRHPSIADVALYPYTRLSVMGGLAPRRSAAIARWLDRFEALPGYEPLFPGRPDLTESAVETRHDG